MESGPQLSTKESTWEPFSLEYPKPRRQVGILETNHKPGSTERFDVNTNLFLLCFLGLLFALTGCQSFMGLSAAPQDSTRSAAGYASFDDYGDGESEAGLSFQEDSTLTDDQILVSIAESTDRKMIYTAQLTLGVARTEESFQRLLTRLSELGGYLAERHDSVITVRVPAESFDILLNELKEFGRVLSQSIQTRDVTKQFADTTLRLENAEKSRSRLLLLLERAEAVADILKIEEELQRLTLEIESLKGELKYLGNQIRFSTITVTFSSVSSQPTQQRRSRFWWINQVGAESIRESF